MKKETAEKILSETEKGYDLISEKFSQTRKHFWSELAFIENYAKKGDKVLDYGCGNARLLELIGKNEIEYAGVDVSGELIKLAQKRHGDRKNNFIKIGARQTRLPFNSNFFNTVYSVAVFHHIPSEELRKEVVKELFRVTEDKGHIMITVWNLWQKKYIKNIFLNWKNKILGKAELDWNDCRITFTDNKGKIFNRYHRAFTKWELKKLFREAGFKIERCDIINNRTIILIGRK